MTLTLLVLALLTAVYALALASVAAADLLFGALLGGGLLLLSRAVTVPAHQPSAMDLIGRVGAFLPLAVIVARDIIVGTWQVAVVVLGLRPLHAPGIVKVPIGNRSPVGVTVSSLIESLSPGSILIDIDWDERVMYFHVVDASDPDQFRVKLRRFYERYQRRVFP